MSVSTIELSVAICIGTYNQGPYIKGAIESALAQTYPISEIWISDDASSDETQRIVQELAEANPIVHYHRQEKNLGLARNLSWVLAQPQTDLVVRLDSDDRLEKRYVEVLAALMRQHPSAGFGHCNVNEIDFNGQAVKTRRLSRSVVFESGDDFLARNTSGFRVAANCLIYRSSALKAANYYEPNVDWRFSEDWDLCLRLADLGWGNVFSQDVLSNYRVWEDEGSFRSSRKLSEVVTTRLIYQQTLEPAFLKRGWDVRALSKGRTSKAIGFTDCLDSSQFDDKERSTYETELLALGGPAALSLKLRIWMVKLGLNPLFKFVAHLEVSTKNLAKRLIYR